MANDNTPINENKMMSFLSVVQLDQERERVGMIDT